MKLLFKTNKKKNQEPTEKQPEQNQFEHLNVRDLKKITGGTEGGEEDDDGTMLHMDWD